MVPKLKDILDLLEEIAPTHLAEEWDNPGLQVGSHSQEVGKIFLSLDPTLQAVKEAAKEKAQLLLAHHPLIFNPVSKVDWELFPGKIIYEAVKNGISIVAAHTNLDMAQGGINDLLADLFHLKDLEVLRPLEGDTGENVGLGRIGNIPEPMKLSGVIDLVKKRLGVEGLKVVGSKDLEIKRVALVGGAGGNFVAAASDKGADLFITGDVGHHAALEADFRGLAVIDGGHFFTEKAAFTLFEKVLRGHLQKKGWKADIVTYISEQNTLNYV